MPIFRALLTATAVTTLTTASIFTYQTRHSRVLPLPPPPSSSSSSSPSAPSSSSSLPTASDPLFTSPHFLRLNPHSNPPTSDICIRRVKLSQIKRELREKGALATAFTQGVFGGRGFGLQRVYLSRKYKTPENARTQLWEARQLLTCEYPMGAVVTDHFEVVGRGEEVVLVRCGDSPKRQGVRGSDGLFEISVAGVGEGEVEFRLKSVFWRGEGKVREGEGGPMGATVQWAHRVYDKVLMESGVRNCLR
ncbi:MAG: hypothetical protein Q9160_004207 [Pyrenula sp. 1 TL-2023]